MDGVDVDLGEVFAGVDSDATGFFGAWGEVGPGVAEKIFWAGDVPFRDLGIRRG